MIMHKVAYSSQRVDVAVELIKLQSQFLSWYVVKKAYFTLKLTLIISPRVQGIFEDSAYFSNVS